MKDVSEVPERRAELNVPFELDSTTMLTFSFSTGIIIKRKKLKRNRSYNKSSSVDLDFQGNFQ